MFYGNDRCACLFPCLRGDLHKHAGDRQLLRPSRFFAVLFGLGQQIHRAPDFRQIPQAQLFFELIDALEVQKQCLNRVFRRTAVFDFSQNNVKAFQMHACGAQQRNRAFAFGKQAVKRLMQFGLTAARQRVKQLDRKSVV